MTIAKYLNLLKKDEQEETSLLKEGASDLRGDPTVYKSVISTWQISFNQIRVKDPLSADLLSRISMFDRQHIPEFLLRVEMTDREFENAIETLLGYAFISMEADEISFNMHRLVQLAMKEWLRLQKDFEKQQIAALRMLAESYPTGEYENWAVCSVLEPHAQVLLNHQYTLAEARRSRIEVLQNRAWYYIEQRNYGAVESMAKQGMCDAAELLGQEHPSTLISMSNLAWMYSNQGRWKEAEELQLQVMEKNARVLGQEHPDTLISTNNLTVMYRYQGRWKEAEELQLQVMETRTRVLGQEHPNTLISMENLACNWMSQGRKMEALSLLERCYRLQDKVLGSEHPHTNSSLAVLNAWRLDNLEAEN